MYNWCLCWFSFKVFGIFGSGPLAQYRNLIEQGKLQYDPNQERVASELDKLFGRLEQYEKDMEEYHVYLTFFFVLHMLTFYLKDWFGRFCVTVSSFQFLFFSSFLFLARKNWSSGRKGENTRGGSFWWRKLSSSRTRTYGLLSASSGLNLLRN